jgi:hypothetical protein
MIILITIVCQYDDFMRLFSRHFGLGDCFVVHFLSVSKMGFLYFALSFKFKTLERLFIFKKTFTFSGERRVI